MGSEKKSVIKFRPLAPVELNALEKARDCIKPMCDLFRMVHGADWSPASLGEDGEMRRRFFELEQILKELPALKDASEKTEEKKPEGRKPLFEPHEKLNLRDGYTDHDRERIKTLTIQMVESRVMKGEVDAEDPVALKKAVMEAGKMMRSAYNAALEYVSG